MQVMGMWLKRHPTQIMDWSRTKCVVQDWFKPVMPSLSKLRKVPDWDCQFFKSAETGTDGPIGPVQVRSGPQSFSSPLDWTFIKLYTS